MTGGIRAIAQLPVRPGHEDEFAERFSAAGVLEKAIETAGMREAVLLRPQEGSTFVVVSTWDSPEAYAAWGQSSVAERLRTTFESLMAGEATTATYVVSDAVAKPIGVKAST